VAEEARAQLRSRLTSWVDEHADSLRAIDAALPQPMAAALEAAGEAAGEPGTEEPRAVFARLLADPVQRQRDQAAALRSSRAALVAERAAAREERDRIAAEHDDAPEPCVARSASRSGRRGAPLWRLVRFADNLAASDAAAIEAALEAANLLDAWVDVEDGVTRASVDAGVADGFLAPLPVSARPAGSTLADVLIAEEQELVGADRVREVLLSVALVSTVDASLATPAVSVTGQFVQGIQLGGYGKAHAEYIGATARQRRRELRIAECDARIATLGVEIDQADAGLERCTALLVAVGEAGKELPDTAPVLTALRRHHEAAVELRLRREAVDRTRARLDEATVRHAATDRALSRVAAERSLDPVAVDEVAGAVRRFENAGQHLAAARRLVAGAVATRGGAAARLDEASSAHEIAGGAAEEAARRHAEQDEQLATLRAALGTDPETIEQRVADARQSIGNAEARLSAAHGGKEAATAELARAETEVRGTWSALELAVAEERRTARVLAPYAVPEVLALLRCPEHLRWPGLAEDWPDPSTVVDGARQSLPELVVQLHDALLAATRDLTPTESSLKQSVTRLNRALEDLQTQLTAAGQDHRPEWELIDSVVVVRVADEQGYAPIGVFGARIAAARAEQEQLLTESERRILEDTLLAQLARQIHDRTVDARDLVARMSTEMRARRMSSGVSVGVGWPMADGLDEEQRAVCALLERDAAGLGPDELARMRAQFASRIKGARAARPDRSYRELLAEVLDYRRWRRFAFTLHRPGSPGGEALTRARHSQLSGGEQSVSLHLPLFAAAHALFESARSIAPRLVALDEAFAGVDEQGRSELMALAVQFDLDLFMTGYDLWATCAAVPATAHYDLSHAPLEHLVSTVLLVWDGAENLADFDSSLAAALGSPLTRRAPVGSPATEPDLLDDE